MIISVSLKKSDSIRYSLDQEELPRQSSADQNNGMEGRSKSSETVTKAKDSALPPKPKKKSFVDSKRGQINEVSQWGDGAVGSDTSTTGEKEGGQVSEASKQSKLNGIARKPSGTPELKSPRAAHYKTVDEMVEEAENKALEAKKHRIARNRHKKEESDIDEDSNSQISKDRKLPAIRSARAMYDNNSNSLIVPVRHPLNSLDDSDGESQGRIHSQSSPTGASGKKRKKPLYLRMIAKAQMKLTEEEKERVSSNDLTAFKLFNVVLISVFSLAREIPRAKA